MTRFSVVTVWAPRSKEEVAALRGVEFDKRPPRKVAGYRVEALLCAGSDEMFEALEHFALFSTPERAAAFAKKCRAGGCKWKEHWVWAPTQCSAFAFMHEAPTAVLETVAR
jgi:hypothetical protein